MSNMGQLTPDRWGAFMPVQNALAAKGPWYYRGTECVVVEYQTDRDAALALLPSDLELYEPATGFMVIETNHRTSFGPYSEIYNGVLCLHEGELYAYVPGVYVTGENSQIVGREVYGFGKKRAERIDLVHHDNGEIHASVDVRSGDEAVRISLEITANLPTDAMGGMPLICLRVVPDPEGGAVPSLAQLVAVSFTAEPHRGNDGRDEVYAARVKAHRFGSPSDVDLPMVDVLGAKYAWFDAVLPYGKVLKTYSEAELTGQVEAKA